MLGLATFEKETKTRVETVRRKNDASVFVTVTFVSDNWFDTSWYVQSKIIFTVLARYFKDPYLVGCFNQLWH